MSTILYQNAITGSNTTVVQSMLGAGNYYIEVFDLNFAYMTYSGGAATAWAGQIFYTATPLVGGQAILTQNKSGIAGVTAFANQIPQTIVPAKIIIPRGMSMYLKLSIFGANPSDFIVLEAALWGEVLP